jgi:four helix bundle protein
MKNFRNLKVWEMAHQLTLDVYRATRHFPREELYGLSSQMRRCSASIGANIAEGCGKSGNHEFHRYLEIASGSASELEYHLLLASDLALLLPPDYQRLQQQLLKTRKMLTCLLQKVELDRCMAKC